MRKIAMFIMLLLIAATTLASGGGGGNPPSPSGAPIDGGISVILILGAMYATYKIHKHKEGD